MPRSKPNRKVNLCVARGVPVFLLALIGYASWVVTKSISIDYLLRPQPPAFPRQRVGTAAAILTTYYVLFLLMLLTYARLVYIVSRNSGVVPRGHQWYIERERNKQEKKNKHANEEKGIEYDSARIRTSYSADESRKDQWVGDFWKRDVFACNYDGRPSFCSSCYNWKPDRAHHCSELNRCVLKMDHFCPWVGGVVGETSFKYFVQFTMWATFFCLHLLVTMAYFFAEKLRLDGGIVVHWTVMLGISALFFMFTGTMFGSSLQFVFVQSTTIENLNKAHKVWCLAIHIPNDRLQKVQMTVGENLRLITYPRPESEQLQIQETGYANLPGATCQGFDASLPQGVTPEGTFRTFGIFETKKKENPWDLGTLRNLQETMGYTIWDWLLPTKTSPLTNHESNESFYTLGPAVERIRREVGIIDDETSRSSSSHRRKKREHRQSHSRS